MRRALASWLIAVFSFPLILPALIASAESSLPLCCRRGGTHHCGMTGEQQAADADATTRVLPAHCPLWPGASMTARSRAAGPVAYGGTCSVLATQFDMAGPYEPRYGFELQRLRRERGPPRLT
jgi:hypothetical protein